MINIQNILRNRILFRTILVLIVIIILILFPGIRSGTDKLIETGFHKITGQFDADSNIVLLTIDGSDIQQLGGWPIKRSYYALVINYLSRYSPKVIGFEIFLSDKASSKSYYDEVLLTEIKKAGNVILSSVANNINVEYEKFYSNSIEKPSIKLKDTTILTGHINYIEDNGIIIPNTISQNNHREKSLSVKIAEKYGHIQKINSIRVNPQHSWQTFNKYGFVDFFLLAEKNDNSLNKLKNKIILIGVSDPTLARGTESYFDNHLPGVALHAFVIENMLNDTMYDSRYYSLSAFVFLGFVFMLIAAIDDPKYLRYYAISIILAIFALFIIQLVFILKLNYAFLFYPLIVLFVGDFIISVFEKEILLNATLDEQEILSRALKQKEQILAALEVELNVKKNDESLLSKISRLKDEIEKIERSKKDEEIEYSSETSKQFLGLVYASGKIDSIIKTIEKVAPQKATVLILGESGSGKELVAKAIHELSSRKNENFIAVNCAALTSSLLESELFGHTKGAFTGAISDKKGVFEAADMGTIFLDEIGETDENFQVKLLRVLQSGEIQKVGSTETKFVDVRVIAATNKILNELVSNKKFREDLFYRLNVINIVLPPLRDRKEDIPVLAKHFAASEDFNLKISNAVMDQLIKYDWKGNVRELESVIKRASIFAKSEKRNIIKIADLPEELGRPDKSDLEDLILESLREKDFSHSSINETAKEFGNLSRTIVSENLRGIFFKNYIFNQFDLEKTVAVLAGSNDEKVITKLKAKCSRYLINIESDLIKLGDVDFERIKQKFVSKYKNLPIKYHSYLDQIINHFLE